jgi:hypothetical protein
LENRDKANILGSEKANEEVAGFVNWNVSNSSSLLLTDVEQRMKTLLGRDVSPQHKVSIGEGLYPNKNGFDLETPRAYKIIEDSLITLVVDFYYTKQDESVKVSSYEWVQTNEWFYSLPKEKNKELVRKKFEARLFQIVESIKADFGEPSLGSQSDTRNSMEWTTENGSKIFLSTSGFEDYFKIELRIYND